MEITKIKPADDLDHTSQWHIWRSKYFDKCAKCECELKRLSASSVDAKMHFKAMAEKILSSNKAGKTKLEKNESLIKLLEELIPLIDLRAELAHSHFVCTTGFTDGVAMLQNANFTHIHFDKLTVLSAEQRKRAYDRLASIAGQLAKLPSKE
jgi:hypothetical protein